MPDLQIPQRQTYPAIRGSVSDQEGLLPTATAEDITLILNDTTRTTIVLLPAVAIDPPEEFLDADGNAQMANWEAPIAGATAAVATEILYDAKLKMVWATGPPLLVQFAPQVGFMQIEVVENLVEA